MLATNLSHFAVLTLLYILVGASPAFAQTDEHESASDHEAEHDFHPNLFALFIGLTDEGREEGLALGDISAF
jgi:hypothetical protein